MITRPFVTDEQFATLYVKNVEEGNVSVVLIGEEQTIPVEEVANGDTEEVNSNPKVKISPGNRESMLLLLF